MAKDAFVKHMLSIWPHISTHILFGCLKVTNDHVHEFSHTETSNSSFARLPDATCHFVSVPKYSARLSTPVTTQNNNNNSNNNNNNNLSSASCG